MSASTGKSRNRAGSPTTDLEDVVPTETVPNRATGRKKGKPKEPEPEADDASDAGGEQAMTDGDTADFVVKMRVAARAYYEEHKAQPSNEELADLVGCEEGEVADAKRKLALERKGKKLFGLRKCALKAGYSRRQDAGRIEGRGLDMEQSLLTSGDIVRLARAMPLSFSEGSYSPNEIKMRIRLMYENLPVSSAREIIAFIEPIYRQIHTEAVARTAKYKAQRVTAATMREILKPYADLGVFTSIVPPLGLVNHGKKDGLGPIKRGFDETLVEWTDEDKTKWKNEKKEVKKIVDMVNVARSEESERKKKRQRASAAEEEEAAEDEAAPAAAPAPAASSKRSKRAAATA